MKRLDSQQAEPISTYIAGCSGCYIHNVLDTKDEPIPEGYDSFLGYWEKNSGQSAPLECQVECTHQNKDGTYADQKELDGAHVRIDDEDCPDDWAWIVPLCGHCNSDGNTCCMKMPSGTVFVPIKMSKPHSTANNKSDAVIKALMG